MSKLHELTAQQRGAAYREIEEPFIRAGNLLDGLLLMAHGLFDGAYTPQPHHGQIFHTVIHAAKDNLVEAEQILNAAEEGT